MAAGSGPILSLVGVGMGLLLVLAGGFQTFVHGREVIAPHNQWSSEVIEAGRIEDTESAGVGEGGDEPLAPAVLTPEAASPAGSRLAVGVGLAMMLVGWVAVFGVRLLPASQPQRASTRARVLAAVRGGSKRR